MHQTAPASGGHAGPERPDHLLTSCRLLPQTRTTRSSTRTWARRTTCGSSSSCGCRCARLTARAITPPRRSSPTSLSPTTRAWRRPRAPTSDGLLAMRHVQVKSGNLPKAAADMAHRLPVVVPVCMHTAFWQVAANAGECTVNAHAVQMNGAHRRPDLPLHRWGHQLLQRPAGCCKYTGADHRSRALQLTPSWRRHSFIHKLWQFTKQGRTMDPEPLCSRSRWRRHTYCTLGLRARQRPRSWGDARVLARAPPGEDAPAHLMLMLTHRRVLYDQSDAEPGFMSPRHVRLCRSASKSDLGKRDFCCTPLDCVRGCAPLYMVLSMAECLRNVNAAVPNN